MADPIQIIDGVHWVGVADPGLRTFDLIMETEFGSTYNAYVVRGEEKTALIETAKLGFDGELMERIGKVVDPASIAYIVVNHTEPDHVGALATVLDAAPNAVVVGTKRAIAFLKEILNHDFPNQTVKAGDTLDLGGRTLRFIPSPFVHWPDTMFTWLEEDRLLFSCDVFGAHYCPRVADGELFDDQIGGDAQADLAGAFRYYYDTIMGPFRVHVAKAMAKLDGLEPAIICTSHGPLLRKDPLGAIATYRELSTVPADAPKMAAVCYASVYGYTKRLAIALAEGLRAGGVEVDLIDLEERPLEQALAVCGEADAVVLGSPTINAGAAPQPMDLLARLDPFRMKGKRFAAFGSYGWSGEAVDVLNRRAADLKMKAVGEGLKVTFAPSDEDLSAAKAYAAEIASAL